MPEIGRIKKIFNRLRRHTVVVVLVAIAGVVGAVATFTKNVHDIVKPFLDEKPKLEQLAKDLGSASIETRILAARAFPKVSVRDANEMESVIRVLESFIARHADNAWRKGEPTEDFVAAFMSLGSILEMSDRRSFTVRKPQFSGLNLSAVDLSGVYLRGTSFSNSSFEEAVLDRADLSQTLFVDVQFSRVQARNARFSSARVRASCLEETIFEGAILDSMESWSSDFNSANMKQTSLRGARFDNTRLANVNFEGADLAAANLQSGLELTAQQLRAAKSLDGTVLPNPSYIKSRLTVCARR